MANIFSYAGRLFWVLAGLTILLILLWWVLGFLRGHGVPFAGTIEDAAKG